jgi:hypothetical protein
MAYAPVLERETKEIPACSNGLLARLVELWRKRWKGMKRGLAAVAEWFAAMEKRLVPPVRLVLVALAGGRC